MKLRPYQQEAVDAVYDHLRKQDDNPCVAMPTGTGKSLVIAQIATDAVERWNGRVLILAHVKELLEQNAQKIRALAPSLDVGIYSAGLKQRDTNNAVVVAGIQSVYRRACDLGRFDLILVDEAHLIPHKGEGMYRQYLRDALTINPTTRLIGLTATPWRLQGGLICKQENMLNKICYEYEIADAIKDGYLSPLTTKASKTHADLSGVSKRNGDFAAGELEAAMDNDAIVRSACGEIVRLAEGRESVLIFTSGVKHCEHVAAEIRRQSGQECAVVTGDTSPVEREEILHRFKGGTVPNGLFDVKPPLRFLTNVNVLTTGFDAPNVDCVVLLRPTQSAGLYVQMVGRGTRLCEGKDDCLVLDFGQNIQRHGPVDAIRSQDVVPSVEGTGEAPVKTCPECQTVVPIIVKECPGCGYVWADEECVTHDATADDAPILGGKPKVRTVEIQDVTYHEHQKRGAAPDHPRTLRVDYWYSMTEKVSEWVCIEHTGFAGSKAADWWARRSLAPKPDKAISAERLGNAGAICETIALEIKDTPGVRWPEIVGYDLGPVPPWQEPGQDEGEAICACGGNLIFCERSSGPHVAAEECACCGKFFRWVGKDEWAKFQAEKDLTWEVPF